MSVEKRTSKKQKCTVLSRTGGLFYGTEADLKNILSHYFGEYFGKGKFESKTKHFGPQTPKKMTATNVPHVQFSVADAQKYVAEHLNPTDPLATLKSLSAAVVQKHNHCKPLGKHLPKAPKVTCDRPHPHKVTSTFPIDISRDDSTKLDQEIVERIHAYLFDSCYFKDVDRYMSFHCLGGAVTDNPSQRAYPYFDKPYMLQIQTWWNLSNDASVDANRKKAYDKWVEDFRNHLSQASESYTKGCIEGAFINFVDKDICGSYELSKKQEILTQYYTEKNLKQLIKIKNKYDPYNLFDFRLSIPLEYK